MRHSQRFEDFVTATTHERQRAELRRDFRDLKQWTDEEAETLRARKQAPIVIDYIGKKVDALTGLENQQRTDPRAFPRTPKHEKSSQAVTDALRFVEYANNLDETFSEVFEEKIVEGYGGVIVEAEETPKGYKIRPKQIHWDRIYFDPHSREKDFSDSTYFGITVWMDFDVAKSMFKVEDFADVAPDPTFDDRPTAWIDTSRKRVRVNQEYYLENGVWMLKYYTGEKVLREPQKSPWLDDDSNPICPIELESDFVDRDNNRYGYIERLMDPQKEINHRRSKGLYMLSSAQIIYEDGAVEDIDQALEDLRKAQGAVKVTPNRRFEVDRNIEMGTAQLQMYQEAKQEMDSVGVNPELAGRTENAISGRAFIAKQQGGFTELARVYGRHSNFKRRVYKQIWYRIKQFWDEEKWLRVTDDDNSMRWVGLNIPVTKAHQLVMEQTGMEIQEVIEQYGPQIDQAIQNFPQLGQVVGTVNNVAELDVDIMVEDVPETLNVQMEQFEVLAQLASSRGDPQMFEALLELSTLRDKDKVLEKFRPNEEQQAAQAEEMQQQKMIQQALIQAEVEGKAAEIENKQADTREKLAKAGKTQAEIEKILSETLQKDLENLGMRKYDPIPNVTI